MRVMMYDTDTLQEAKVLLMKYCHMSEKDALMYIVKTAKNLKVQKEVVVSQILHIYR